MIRFTPENHKYESIKLEDQLDWISVTSIVSHFKQPFDPKTQAVKSSKNKKSKWHGITPEEVESIWKREGIRSTVLGNWYHDQRENDVTDFKTIEREGIELPVVKPLFDNGIKIAPSQVLETGIYPEHLVYLKSAGICGQSDRVEVIGNRIKISDYKTNKKIEMQGFTSWDGVTKKLSGPLSHLDDCHIVHYGLQLSIYMYIILKHNPRLKAGKLTIQHVSFESEGDNEFGYPITKYSAEGDPIIKDITNYEVPYMKEEVLTMINWLKDNKK